MSDSDNKSLKSYKHLNLHRGAKTAKLGVLVTAIDAWAFVPMFALWFNRSTATILIVMATTLLFVVLEVYFKYSPKIALGRFKSFLAGRRRYVGRYHIRRRRFNNGN